MKTISLKQLRLDIYSLNLISIGIKDFQIIDTYLQFVFSLGSLSY
jgi:hypothetical protein